MTEALASKTCTPCRGAIPPLTREQAEFFHAQAPEWQLLEEAHRIERSFRFRNFREALTFVQEVGELAEAEGHHPNISFGWGNATVSLQTKKIKGLHENDFIMATKIDRIFARTAAGVNEFCLSCIAPLFSVPTVSFDMRKGRMRQRASWGTATRSPLMFDVFQAGGQPARLFATGSSFDVRLQSGFRRIPTGKGRRQANIDKI